MLSLFESEYQTALKVPNANSLLFPVYMTFGRVTTKSLKNFLIE